MADNTDESKIKVFDIDFAVECMGDLDTVKMFTKQFIDETLPRNLKDTSEGWKNKDLEAIQKKAHNGKGISS